MTVDKEADNRIFFLDWLKGIAIILVLTLHFVMRQEIKRELW